MSGFLSQIEKRQETLMQEHAATQAADERRPKVVAIKVPPELRDRLEAVKKRHGFKSIKETLRRTAEIGVNALLK